jgi:beta-glucosidase/6-phospho-beta-glucosidase/beta-galactosidase
MTTDSLQDLFATFFMGGFECSTHRLRSGRRLDLIAATGHDRFCEQDYARLRGHGLGVAREGLRWHLIEDSPGHFDFTSALPMVRASQKHGVQVLWDICHYGWPEGIDIFTPEFVRRYSQFAKQFAQWLAGEMDGPFFISPINEISYFAWAGGDDPHLNPYCRGRGFELKCQLVRAAVEGMEAIWSILPRTRFLQIDPLIHIVPHPHRPKDRPVAEGYRLAQYQAFDMLAGRTWPQLGGAAKYLDIIGLNFYPNNEWIYEGRALRPPHALYRPLRELLQEVKQRYGRPLFLAETGTEGTRRVPWLRYVCQEVRAAIESGIPLQGICLYPIVNHPGWINQRHCHNGLWDYPDERGQRALFGPLARELERWQAVFEERFSNERAREALSNAPFRSQPKASAFA